MFLNVVILSMSVTHVDLSWVEILSNWGRGLSHMTSILNFWSIIFDTI